MTPAKTGTTARATFRFDRRIKGVGRLALSSGARTRREHQRREGIVTKLIEAGALDTLRALRDGRITMADLVAADRRGVLATSPSCGGSAAW